MGIAFITAKANKYSAQRDAAYEEQIAAENLFSKASDSVADTFRCKCTCGEVPEVGTPLVLYLCNGGIKVLHLNQEIGLVMAPDSAELRNLMHKLATSILSAEVVKRRPLSGIILVELQTM